MPEANHLSIILNRKIRMEELSQENSFNALNHEDLIVFKFAVDEPWKNQAILHASD